MRLLMTTDAVGGVWTYSLTLARGLAARGWEVMLAVLGPAPRLDQRQELEAIRGCRLMATGLPLDWMAQDDAAIGHSGEKVARLASAWGADIVHLNSPALAAEAPFDQPVVGACHSCLASWWETLRDGPMPPAFARHTEWLRRGYANASVLLAPSRSFARQTAALYGRAEPLVVHNGWDAPPSGLERQAGLILAAGRLWDEAKGMKTLIAAARQLSFPVNAAGPARGPNGQAIDLAPVRHLGALSGPALAAWREQAGIFVSCSLYEPFGLAVLEAAASGCALLLSDIPTFRELWDGSAVFSPPGDSEALAENLNALARAPALVEQMGQAARARAERYSLARLVERSEQIYRARLAADSSDVREAAA